MQKTNGFQSFPCVFLEFKSIHKLCFYILSIMLHTLKNQVTPGCEQTLKQEGATDAASTTISLVTQKGIDDTSTTGCRTHPSVTPLTHSDDGGETRDSSPRTHVLLTSRPSHEAMHYEKTNPYEQRDQQERDTHYYGFS